MYTQHVVALMGCVWAVLGCVDDGGCNWAGNCVGGTCECVKGFAGVECAELNMGVSWKCGEGGLCVDGENTWGAGVVEGDDGLYHMYACAMSEGCDLNAFFSNAVVIHATSPTPQGPYTPTGVTLSHLDPPASSWDGLIQGNPNILRSPNGTYILYYLGSTALDVPPVNCTAGDTPHLAGASICSNTSLIPYNPVCRQQIGLAYSPTPTGPWTRRSQPILGPGPSSAWDDLFVTNPAVHIFKNESALLIYKARSKENVGAMHTGVASAEHWMGPYTRRQPSVPIPIPSDCEDAGIYYDEGMAVFRMLMHCGCNYVYLWSKDGASWTAASSPNPWCHVT
eukprot:TRINITY_DN46895_c0_g1_i1.p1 TRINITY_DN46895_c0_g1~~TRINITY_DN46895_c0_g1_i1.p1  ORF type:complete len:338 (+),score=63.98 TRINITY_DN46895_c0_g1_i1:23-1036(+)